LSLGSLLASHVRSGDLGRVVGEAGFKLAGDPDTVRGPDVAFVRRERLDSSLGPEGFFHGAPDLAVEIVSPGDTALELRQKIGEYLQAGARLVWVLQPDARTVIVHRPGASPETVGPDDLLDGEDVIPGFTCRAGDLFD
jgi:Uma2 family endonuclease